MKAGRDHDGHDHLIVPGCAASGCRNPEAHSRLDKRRLGRSGGRRQNRNRLRALNGAGSQHRDQRRPGFSLGIDAQSDSRLRALRPRGDAPGLPCRSVAWATRLRPRRPRAGVIAVPRWSHQQLVLLGGGRKTAIGARESFEHVVCVLLRGRACALTVRVRKGEEAGVKQGAIAEKRGTLRLPPAGLVPPAARTWVVSERPEPLGRSLRKVHLARLAQRPARPCGRPDGQPGQGHDQFLIALQVRSQTANREQSRPQGRAARQNIGLSRPSRWWQPFPGLRRDCLRARPLTPHARGAP
jgi:hypothetical protein